MRYLLFAELARPCLLYERLYLGIRRGINGFTVAALEILIHLVPRQRRTERVPPESTSTISKDEILNLFNRKVALETEQPWLCIPDLASIKNSNSLRCKNHHRYGPQHKKDTPTSDDVGIDNN